MKISIAKKAMVKLVPNFSKYPKTPATTQLLTKVRATTIKMTKPSPAAAGFFSLVLVVDFVFEDSDIPTEKNFCRIRSILPLQLFLCGKGPE